MSKITAAAIHDPMLEHTRNRLPFTHTPEPDSYSTSLDSIDRQTRGLAIEIERLEPRGRFGMRAFEHMQDIAREAGLIAESEGLTQQEAGLLKIVCRAGGIGDQIQRLCSAGRVDTIPSEIVSLAESPNERLNQQRSSKLSYQFLLFSGSLATLSEAERKIVETAVVECTRMELSIKSDHPAFKLAVLAQDIYKTDTIRQRDFLTASGALEEFVKVASSHYGIPTETAKDALSGNSPFAQTARAFVQAIIDDAVNKRYDYEVALLVNDQQGRMALAIKNWFTGQISSEVVAGKILPFLAGKTKDIPTLTEDESKQNYASQMLGQIITTLEISRPSIVQSLLREGHIQARAKYVYSVTHDLTMYNNLMTPLAALIRGKCESSARAAA